MQVLQVHRGPSAHPCGRSVQRQGSLNRMDGLIKCSIVPPERLYLPVLPFRANQKLMFCLCRTCGYRRCNNPTVWISRPKVWERVLLRQCFGYIYSAECRTVVDCNWVKAGDMQFELRPPNTLPNFRQVGQRIMDYKVITNEGEITLRKVRCINLNYHALKSVNFEAIRAMNFEQG